MTDLHSIYARRGMLIVWLVAHPLFGIHLRLEKHAANFAAEPEIFTCIHFLSAWFLVMMGDFLFFPHWLVRRAGDVLEAGLVACDLLGHAASLSWFRIRPGVGKGTDLYVRFTSPFHCFGLFHACSFAMACAANFH